MGVRVVSAALAGAVLVGAAAIPSYSLATGGTTQMRGAAEDLARSADSNVPNPRSAARIVSGKLPNGANFVLPPVGQPPYPSNSGTKALPGSKSGALVDDVPAYVPQTSCDPREKVGITAFKNLVMKAFPGGSDWGSSRNCTDDGISEHLEGRAWDWNMNVKNPAQFSQAGQLLQWLTKNNGVNARRLGIMYIGYNYRIWGAYRAREGWRQLNNSNPHTDHVHFSFSWNGATKSTSFWAGKTFSEDYGPCRVYNGQPAPLRTKRNVNGCPSPAALPAKYRGAGLLWRGSSGARVELVQSKLAVTPRSGFFGALTQQAVARYQKERGLPVTGAVDARTWVSLGIK